MDSDQSVKSSGIIGETQKNAGISFIWPELQFGDRLSFISNLWILPHHVFYDIQEFPKASASFTITLPPLNVSKPSDFCGFISTTFNGSCRWDVLTSDPIHHRHSQREAPHLQLWIIVHSDLQTVLCWEAFVTPDTSPHLSPVPVLSFELLIPDLHQDVSIQCLLTANL